MNWLVTGLALLATVGCKKPEPWSEREVDHSLVEVRADRLMLRTDAVGEARFESNTTFVLVDAVNRHDTDLMVTLGGALTGADGAALGQLRPESLRVPAGGKRTFALLDDKNRSLAGASGATVDVVGAHVVDYPPPVRVTEGYVHPKGDGMMASATIANTAERHVKVVVLGGFHGADGQPLTRPYTVLELAGHTSHPVHFTSPPGAKEGYVFIGQMVY